MAADPTIARPNNVHILARRSGVRILIRQCSGQIAISWDEVIPLNGALADTHKEHQLGVGAAGPTVGHQSTNQAVNVASPNAEEPA